VDNYPGADDELSMEDNNTAFNCRGIPGTDRWSQHAFGRAIDLNPYIDRTGAFQPKNAGRQPCQTPLGPVAFTNVGPR
jgi:hypothetical protein